MYSVASEITTSRRINAQNMLNIVGLGHLWRSDGSNDVSTIRTLLSSKDNYDEHGNPVPVDQPVANPLTANYDPGSDERFTLCEMAIAMPYFLFAFLMIWVLQMYITGAPVISTFGWLIRDATRASS